MIRPGLFADPSNPAISAPATCGYRWSACRWSTWRSLAHRAAIDRR